MRVISSSKYGNLSAVLVAATGMLMLLSVVHSPLAAQTLQMVMSAKPEQVTTEPKWASEIRSTLELYASGLEGQSSGSSAAAAAPEVGVIIIYRRTPQSGLTREGQTSADMERVGRLEEKAAELSISGVQVVRSLTQRNAIRAQVSADDIQSLLQDPDIEDVLVERFERALQSREGNSLFVRTSLIQADTLWNMGYTGAGQVVAIIDDGIYANHEAFSGRIVQEGCFSTPASSIGVESLCPGGVSQMVGSGAASVCDGESEYALCWHGTHVAGIVAGNDPNGDPDDQNDGVAFDAQIIPIQVFVRVTNSIICGDETPPCYRTSSLDTYEALEWVKFATGEFNIVAVNMSLGGGSYSNYCFDDPRVGPIEDLKDLGVLTTIASGNEGEVGAVSAPACVEAGIAVSSTFFGDPSDFANHAEIVDLLAPGEIIFSASRPPSTYEFSSGTSMSAPFVAGAIALLREARPNATVEQIEYALKYSSNPTMDSSWSWETPDLRLGTVMDFVDDYVAPSGTRLLGVQSSANTLGNTSLIRIFNNEDSAGEVTFTFIDDSDGTELGRYTTFVQSKASFEFGVPDLENAMGVTSPGQSSYTTIVNSRFAGFASHIIRNENSGIWMDATNCVAGVTSDQTVLMNVPTPRFIAGYQPLILVHNAADVEATPNLSAYEFRNGTLIGSVSTADPIPPATTVTLTSQSIFDALEYEPAATEFYFNLLLESGFDGTVGQALQHTSPQLTANMSDRCAVN